MLSDEQVKVCAMLGTGFTGIVTGCLTFVSFVDVRSFITHLNNKKTELIMLHFPIWWPYGRDIMVPLLVCGTICNSITYYHTSIQGYLIAAILIGCIGPYTGIVLGEDIDSLRKSNPKEVDFTARRFCNLHHFRLLVAIIAFGYSLHGLSEL